MKKFIELFGGPEDGLIIEILTKLEGIFIVKEDKASSHYIPVDRFSVDGNQIFEFKEYVYYEPFPQAGSPRN